MYSALKNKNKKKEGNPGDFLEIVVFICIVGNVILGTILSEHMTVSPGGVYRSSE
jgi:hypothetical protein